ncbi:MAG: hypothetical protein J6C62_10035 [Clostridia bacterium]|nr:hypothetical protein [Clostridia bacterium]
MIRKDYVNAITDSERKRQSAYVWMLLQKALADIKVDGNFSVDSKGRWRIIEGGARFSLTHSGNIVAVAVGNSEYLGVDVEKCAEKVLKLQSKLGDYKATNMSNIEYLTREWTKKESAYKAGKKCDFYSRKVFDKIGNEYFITLCTKDKFDEFEYVDVKKIFKLK